MLLALLATSKGQECQGIGIKDSACPEPNSPHHEIGKRLTGYVCALYGSQPAVACVLDDDFEAVRRSQTYPHTYVYIPERTRTLSHMHTPISVPRRWSKYLRSQCKYERRRHKYPHVGCDVQ